MKHIQSVQFANKNIASVCVGLGRIGLFVATSHESTHDAGQNVKNGMKEKRDEIKGEEKVVSFCKHTLTHRLLTIQIIP